MNQIATTEHANALQSAAAEFANLLPEGVSVERFVEIGQTALMKNPKLAECDRDSLLMEFRACAKDGLLPDGKEAVIVPYKKTAQYMPMVRGVIKVLASDGGITSITANVVYQADQFDYFTGDRDEIKHAPKYVDRGLPVCAYAIFRSGDKVIHREVMSIADINKARNASRTKDGAVWKNWFDEMARKTVIRRGSKYIPLQLSERATRVIEAEDRFTTFAQAEQPAQITDQPAAANTTAVKRESDGPDPQKMAKDLCGELSGAIDRDGLMEIWDRLKPELEVLQSISAPAHGYVYKFGDNLGECLAQGIDNTKTTSHGDQQASYAAKLLAVMATAPSLNSFETRWKDHLTKRHEEFSSQDKWFLQSQMSELRARFEQPAEQREMANA